MTEFRNINTANLDFDSKINLFYGKNGQGKTSLLEAIFALCFTRSFRERSDQVLKNHDSKGYELNGFFTDDTRKFSIRVSFKGQKKAIYFNQNPVRKFSELIGTVPVVALTPEDLKLTLGGPGERRHFFDIVLSQVYPAYLDALQAFREALRQKNELLGGAMLFSHERDLIASWNEIIAKNAAEIIDKRKLFADWINQHSEEGYQDISGKQHDLKLDYKPVIIGTAPELIDILNHKMEAEIKRKQSIYGPHRDEIDISLNNHPIRQMGSQGENKTALIVLKLLEIRFLQQFRKTSPIILFDDIFSELDEQRIENLLKKVVSLGQVFITSTTPWYKGNDEWNIRYFEINSGSVAEA